MNEKFTEFLENNSKLVFGIGAFVILLPFIILLFTGNDTKKTVEPVTNEQVNTGTNAKPKEPKNTLSPLDKNYSSEKVALESLKQEKEQKNKELITSVKDKVSSSLNYMLSLNHFSEISTVSENSFSASRQDQQEMLANIVNNGFVIEENSIKVFSNGNKENYHIIFNMYDRTHDNRITYKTIYYPADQKFEIIEFYGSLSKSFARE